MSGMMQLMQDQSRTQRTRSNAARGGGGGSASASAAGASQQAPSGSTKRQQPNAAASPAKKKPLADAGVVIGADGRPRCPWSAVYTGAAAGEYVAYHDTEWGRPQRRDDALFELLILEMAQAGLSWSTVLAKRAAYRAAFPSADIVAAFTSADVDRLMVAEGGGPNTIVRHRGKIEAAVAAAKAVRALAARHGSFSAWLWGFVPDGRPIVNRWTAMSQVPTHSRESEVLSAALKKEGCKYVGPVTCYSLLQGAGLVNDHLVGCFCHAEALAEAAEAEG